MNIAAEPQDETTVVTGKAPRHVKVGSGIAREVADRETVRRSSTIRYRVGRTANLLSRGRLQRHFAGRGPRLVTRTIHCPRWPDALDGFRILHLSDFHVGEMLSVDQAIEVVRQLAGIDVHMTAVTGDFIDYRCEGVEPLLELLVDLPSELGTWGVLGNHDKIVDTRQFMKACREAGLPILNNAAARISVGGVPLRLSGIDWDYDVQRIHQFVAHVCRVPPVDVAKLPVHESDGIARRGDAVARGRQLGEVPDRGGSSPTRPAAAAIDEPHILLAHHPDAFDAAHPRGVDLVLSGHTHGGQFNLKRKSQRHGGQHVGLGLLTHRYPWGVYGRGESRLHVTSGVGSWFPFRVNCPAEVVVLEIRSGEVERPTRTVARTEGDQTHTHTEPGLSME